MTVCVCLLLKKALIEPTIDDLLLKDFSFVFAINMDEYLKGKYKYLLRIEPLFLERK